MIVRLMGEGQFRIDDGLREGLNELDDQAAKAVEQGDEESLHRLRADALSSESPGMA